MITPGTVGTRRLVALDAVVAAALVLVAAFRAPGAALFEWALALVLCAPLVLRRRWPRAVLGVVVLAGMSAIITGSASDVVVLAIAFALYPVGLSSPALHSWLALAGALAGIAIAGLAVVLVPGLPLVAVPENTESFATTPMPVFGYSAVVLAGSWALARTVRARRGQAAQLAELRARQAAVEERLRIARDVHDVVGHNLSLIAMKAAVANHLVDSHPEEGRAALATIEWVSRSALADVRAVLGALRDSADASPDSGFDGLVENVRSAGVAVEFDESGLAEVPMAVRASAYRIAQEALTNVLRHARATSCRLGLTAAAGVLTVSVVDDGKPPERPGPPGQGLLGMRERVALHGGTIGIGPEPGGGFAVRARLPFEVADE
ncbi:sensor histidine kinase [Saccharopolyspora sp. NPDC050389]|uniref:sensor histidine kinase n=1 Tax=Saccharopolyspora sp. NPDC050389 TaxID=3155516 RepID=UPI0033F9CEC2